MVPVPAGFGKQGEVREDDPVERGSQGSTHRVPERGEVVRWQVCRRYGTFRADVPQAIVNMFQRWYRHLGFVGCSSHSGRRTFITNAARKISTVGGSLRDVQILAGHSNLRTTQRYIEPNPEAQVRI